MQKTFDSLKDNDIEIIVLAYLVKHSDFLDTHYDKINGYLFANSENLKIFNVLEDFQKSQKNISIETIKNYRNSALATNHASGELAAKVGGQGF